MATVTSQGSGNWSDATKWHDGGGNNRVPLADDIVIIATGHTMVIDVAGIGDPGRIPATSGSLASLTCQGTGTATIDMTGYHSGLGIYVTGDIQAGTTATAIDVSGNADHTLTVYGNIKGGTGAAGNGIRFASSNAAVLTIVGSITGGSANTANGVTITQSSNYVNITGNITGGSAGPGLTYTWATSTTAIDNSIITGGGGGSAPGINNTAGSPITLANTGTQCFLVNSSTCMAINGKPPTWNLTGKSYWRLGSIYFSAGLSSDSSGTVIAAAGTAALIRATGYFIKKDDGVLTQGTIATKTVSNATVSQDAGYYAAFNLATVDADLVNTNIKKDAVVYGITGTYEAAGGGGRPEIRGGNL